METIIEHFECICTAIEPHGDHGYDPPLRDIGNEVSNWLQGLDLNIDYDIETPFTYRLQVEVHRVPVGREFTGVRACRIPKFNTRVLELRVRPPGSDYQWQVYLIPTSNHFDSTGKYDVLTSILQFVYPGTLNCIARYKTQQETQIAHYRKIKNTKAGKELRNKEKIMLEHIRSITNNNSNAKKMCYAIKNQFNSDNTISNCDLHSVISEYFDCEIAQEVWYMFLKPFMLLGLIEPISADNDDTLCATALFDEYVEELQAEKDKKEQQQKEQTIGNYIETICHNGNPRKLCWTLKDIFDSDGLALSEDLRISVGEFLNYEIQPEDWTQFLDTLLLLRLVKSVSEDNNDILQTTELFDGFVEEVQAEKLSKARQQIDREISDLMEEKAEVVRAKKALLKSLNEYRKRFRTADREIKAAKKRRAEIDVE